MAKKVLKCQDMNGVLKLVERMKKFALIYLVVLVQVMTIVVMAWSVDLKITSLEEFVLILLM